ncbi:SDR family oxidoreductase [Nocardioides sp. GY 10113]|uniref:SDR family oxidoreductase n=1 Tax=Nocardioides sp. GY 10113 TaxID=2569761 RepID=UPI0010A8C135|nr:SDR family oxidoreductase [Nocardioides sp. GY 10113]TIC87510.1 SDR family oxidoreductase [Nocardioides sp. GY 10113]
MRIAIVGGHGKIARLLHPLLVGAGHQPVALVRRDSYRERLEGMGAEVRLVDLENDDESALAEAFAGCHAVVFAAGAGPDGKVERKRSVDLEGALKSIAAARISEIQRFVQVSAINVDEPVPDDAEPAWRAYVAAKRDADAALRASDLDWTIVRPGLLTDAPGTGLVALGPDVARGEIPRADVAAVIAAVLTEPATVGYQWNVVGGATPVKAAIDAALGG